MKRYASKRDCRSGDNDSNPALAHSDGKPQPDSQAQHDRQPKGKLIALNFQPLLKSLNCLPRPPLKARDCHARAAFLFCSVGDRPRGRKC